MSERVIIFIIIASTIVAVTLIAALMQIAKSIYEARASKYSLAALEMLTTYEDMENAEQEQ